MSVYKRSRTGCWFGDYTDAATGKRVRLSLKTKEKGLAERILARHKEDAIQTAAGLADPYKKHTDRPLRDHLDDWRQVLTSKNGVRHVGETIRYVREVLAGCRVTSNVEKSRGLKPTARNTGT